VLRPPTITNTDATSLAPGSCGWCESQFPKSARSDDHIALGWVPHELHLEREEIILNVQSELFPIIAEFVELDELEELLRIELELSSDHRLVDLCAAESRSPLTVLPSGIKASLDD